jgi:hypothetical protein
MKWVGDIKNTNVELPDDLHHAVKTKALALKKSARQAYQEALEAWLSGAGLDKSIGTVGDIDFTKKNAGSGAESSTVPVAPEPKSDIKSDLLQVTESDEPWVRKLLQVLHSAKPGLATAIQNNMNEFAWADEAWNELKGLKSPPVSAPSAGAGERGGPPKELTPTDGIGEHPRRSPRRPRRAKPRLDAIEEIDRESEKGKKDAPRKTG